MALIFLPTGKRIKHEFRTEQEYIECCKSMRQQHGIPLFEMPCPNKKIFTVFRDRQDNEIEVIFKPITIGG